MSEVAVGRSAVVGHRARVADPVDPAAYVDLYWLPLGAGGHVVRTCGRAFELVDAALHARAPLDLYHSALEVRVHDHRYVIEQGPVWNVAQADRGVVSEGPVGARGLARSRLFRYEVRCWLDGRIPDVGEAVASPRRLSTDVARATRVLDLALECPSATWGRDEQRVGEMWNSNSLISWLLTGSGHDTDLITPPPHGRAPGWRAGIVVAGRQSRRQAAAQVGP